MKMFVVTYTLHKATQRAFLNLKLEEEILPVLKQYHRVNADEIKIKNIREIPRKQKFIYLQYFDEVRCC